MNTLEVCVITTLSATLSVVCVYLYLYVQYRERYIGLWFLSWLTSAAFLRNPPAGTRQSSSLIISISSH